jgi:hypothetical protein
MAPSVVAMSRVAPPSAASSTLLQSSISRPGIDDQPRRAAPPQRHPRRSRSGAEARTREPFGARRQVAGEPRRRIRAGAGNVAEWVPDTAASAALGGRSGMTRRLCGFPGVTRRDPRIGANRPTPAGRRFWPAPWRPVLPPRRHPGRSRSAAEARTREPFRARRQAAAWPRCPRISRAHPCPAGTSVPGASAGRACAGPGRGLVARGTRGRSPRGVLRPSR